MPRSLDLNSKYKRKPLEGFNHGSDLIPDIRGSLWILNTDGGRQGSVKGT